MLQALLCFYLQNSYFVWDGFHRQGVSLAGEVWEALAHGCGHQEDPMNVWKINCGNYSAVITHILTCACFEERRVQLHAQLWNAAGNCCRPEYSWPPACICRCSLWRTWQHFQKSSTLASRREQLRNRFLSRLSATQLILFSVQCLGKYVTLLAASMVPLCRLSLENPWQGGPPQTTSTIPGWGRDLSVGLSWDNGFLTLLMFIQIPSQYNTFSFWNHAAASSTNTLHPGKFAAKAFAALGSLSTAHLVSVSPEASRPLESPPQPAYRSSDLIFAGTCGLTLTRT